MRPTLYKLNPNNFPPSIAYRIIKSRWAKMRINGMFKGLTPFQCHELRMNANDYQGYSDLYADWTLYNMSKELMNREEKRLTQKGVDPEINTGYPFVNGLMAI